MFRRVHNYNKILFARNFDHLTVPLGVTRALLLVDSKWQMTGWTKCHQNRYGSSLYPYACGRKRAPRSEHFQFFWATLRYMHFTGNIREYSERITTYTLNMVLVFHYYVKRFHSISKLWFGNLQKNALYEPYPEKC